MTSNADVVLAVIKAVEDRDAETLNRLYHDELEFHEAPSLPYGGRLKGKNVLRDQLESDPEKTWLGTWGPLQPTEAERRMDPRVVAVGDNEVVVTYRNRGVSPDGDRFESEVLALYEVRDGKFSRAQMFHFDTAALIDFFDRSRRQS
ncbi:nuclear transport factor 2 family protein [Mycobacterium sp. ITM-2016-00318]|uniref:nuclear transport factor 2 family protein n=1 Tax=Mycobacterium sp. ITM-2016-00318 TaxID=2099693 RepID=UPI000CF84B50|nr:nuclear transport factor 2 family protein [Mycobacterium sp. ITM-2016-00318]WNG93623.1 nuclear transport factor 2 family protein [Mycobacterium sp. ITM-2016-00318]